MQQLVDDFVNVRKASISFIDTLSESQMVLKGMARQYEIPLEDFLRSIIGHEVHHMNIIKEWRINKMLQQGKIFSIQLRH